eukprot:13499783-Alexandrium_andersonii.AAC.1
MSPGPNIQPDWAAVPSRPTGQAAFSAAPNRRKSATPASLPHCQAQEAPRPAFADSEPRRGSLGTLGVLGPQPPRAGFWAPSSL